LKAERFDAAFLGFKELKFLPPSLERLFLSWLLYS